MEEKKPSQNIKRDVEFLFELGTLRHTQRGWNYLVNPNLQNVVEHEYRVLWTTYVLSLFLEQPINLGKALSIALVRNIYQSRTGVPHYVSEPNVQIDKQKAIHDCLANTSFEETTSLLIAEYEAKQSLESQLVYTANLIEDVLELRELKTNGMELAGVWIERIYEHVYPKVLLAMGKEFLDKIQNIKPYDWHLSAPDALHLNQGAVQLENPIDKATNFLYEVGTARTLERSWNQFAGESFSNVAEHSFRTAWIGYIIAASTKTKIDLSKTILMSMLHDLDEIRGADLNYIQTQYVERDQDKSFSQTVEWLTSSPTLNKLYTEYKNRESIESQIVKDADRLDPIIELQEIKAIGVDITRLWKDLNYERLQKKMYTEYGEELLKQISISVPHDWHIKSDNRFKHEW